MISDNLFDASDFSASEVAAVSQSKWIQPDLRHAILALDMDVRRFATITRIKEKTIRSLPQNRRHTF